MTNTQFINAEVKKIEDIRVRLLFDPDFDFVQKSENNNMQQEFLIALGHLEIAARTLKLVRNRL